jgi:hypothetical protein
MSEHDEHDGYDGYDEYDGYDDGVFKRLADSYVERQGSKLLNEQDALRQQNLKYATPRANKLVKNLVRGGKDRGMGARRNKRPLFATAAAAACLVLLIGAFAVFTNRGTVAFLKPDSAQNPTLNSSAPSTLQDSWSILQPLDFNLPSQFSVVNTDWDNGQSIYKLNSTMHDDVVLTIQQWGGQDDWYTPMDRVTIDGRAVPATIKDEYKLLRFVDEGALYTISCRDDLGTLANLYRSIVDPENKKV